MKQLQEALDKVEGIKDQLAPNLTIVEGKKLNKKGNIIDDEGEILAKLVEGDPKACAGKIPNENGEILDDEGSKCFSRPISTQIEPGPPNTHVL